MLPFGTAFLSQTSDFPDEPGLRFMSTKHQNRLADLLKKVVKANQPSTETKTKATQLWLPGFDPDEPVEFHQLILPQPNQKGGYGR